MDSCEYLSKHFGMQTIHKASDSDSKDHRGSLSRSEDVLEKSLLSAEDIFAMKKDGECAIVVKYDPKMRCQGKVKEKSGLILQGEKAKEEARKLRSERVHIITLTVDDVNLLFDACKSGTKNLDFPPDS